MNMSALMARTSGPARVLSPAQIERLMVEVEKGQQVAGHFPSVEALDRARRVLMGHLTADQAFAEIDARFM